MTRIKSTKNIHTGYGYLKAKKSLGQNFLKSRPALDVMCKVSNLTPKDIVLEIGPGKGALTNLLLKNVSRVVAVEKDKELIKYLNEKFYQKIKEGELILIEKDILDFDLEDFKKYELKDKEYKIVANIPYNITGIFIRRFLSGKIQPKIMTLLVQKEVAQRITDQKKENILSLSIKAYGNPSYKMKVGKRFFSPIPKVDSAIITIKDISRNNFTSDQEEKLFFSLIKAGFSHKRKFLKKNLESFIDREKIIEIFNKLNIDEKIRAENLPIKKWLKIIKIIKQSSAQV